MSHTVTVIPGDGIGPAVVDAARRVVDATGAQVEWDERSAVSSHTGELDGDTVESIRRNGVALKGPLATGVAGGRSPNVELRRRLDLFVQMRPAAALSGAAGSPVDVVVVRETTEDLYRGIESPRGTSAAHALVELLGHRGPAADLAPDTGFSIKPTSPEAVRRALRFTLDWMVRAGRHRLTVVHKATVMRATDGIFLEVAAEVEGGGIEIDDCQVDFACAALIRDPGRFDVMFMPNMYGDIVSDVAAALVGGVGMAPGANYGDGVAVYEAVHGTAPLHAERGDANPLAMVRCAEMLLDHLGEADAARRVRKAVAALVEARRVVTYDVLGSRVGAALTNEVADELVRLVRS